MGCGGSKENPILVLHLDVNKTLIFGDSVKNKGYESSIKEIIIGYSWGKINQTTGEWELTEDKLSFTQPRKGSISFRNYIDMKYPKKTEAEIPDKAQRAECNTKIKILKENLADSFLDKGSPGEKLYPTFQELIEKLKVPKDVLSKIDDSSPMKKLYSSGFYFTFLGLFLTMIKLRDQNRNFSIIFRSFGGDTKDVIDEFNEFCKGNHPMFDGKHFPRVYFDGTHGSKNYLITKEQQGLFYRFSEKVEHTTLVIGTTERMKEQPTLEKIQDALKDEVQKGEVTIINSALKIYHHLKEEVFTGKHNSFVINDNYTIWFENDQRTEFSKPMFINPYDFRLHQIFFDDNIKDTPFSIVDCRNAITGKTMDNSFIKNKYIIKTDSIEASINHDYFYDHIIQAEKLREKDCTEFPVFKANEKNFEDKALLAFKKEGLDKTHLDVFLESYIYATK